MTDAFVIFYKDVLARKVNIVPKSVRKKSCNFNFAILERQVAPFLDRLCSESGGKLSKVQELLWTLVSDHRVRHIISKEENILWTRTYVQALTKNDLYAVFTSVITKMVRTFVDMCGADQEVRSTPKGVADNFHSVKQN